MLASVESRLREEEQFLIQPPVKKIRSDSGSSDPHSLEAPVTVRNLELEGVKELFQDYDLLEAEAVSCVICGKNYKSKVCVKKHLWEHSVYWDLFDGLKKQQRVLSIQAAIILAIKFNPSLSLLLVTNSSSGNKKNKEKREESKHLTIQPRQPYPPQQTTTDRLHPTSPVDILPSPPVAITTTPINNINRKRKVDEISTSPAPPSHAFQFSSAVSTQTREFSVQTVSQPQPTTNSLSTSSIVIR
ncbi:uncharacterized protein [Clytia hemisphaerica]|uniref:C2H2-type domain-containing protein n=1 Tax=Clytia hemisphaerica TaxID=252671 RepID=A0A7M5UWX3_9CNID